MDKKEPVAFKKIFGPTFESLLKGELEAHLGYKSNEHNPKAM
ncbi:MAG: hypothetical protein VZR24_19385 [Butyrivibrio hungatei]|nr:hypothetical protein [Butyrivibrio hungatei]